MYIGFQKEVVVFDVGSILITLTFILHFIFIIKFYYTMTILDKASVNYSYTIKKLNLCGILLNTYCL